MKKKNWSIGKSGKPETNNENENLIPQNNLGENANSSQSVLGSENNSSDKTNEVLVKNALNENAQNTQPVAGIANVMAENTQQVGNVQNANMQNVVTQNIQPVDGMANAIAENTQPVENVQNANMQNVETQNVQPVGGASNVVQNTQPVENVQNVQPLNIISNVAPQNGTTQNTQPVEGVTITMSGNPQPVENIQNANMQNVEPQNVQPVGVAPNVVQNTQPVENVQNANIQNAETQNVQPVAGMQNVIPQNTSSVAGVQNPVQPQVQTDVTTQGENPQGEMLDNGNAEVPKKSKFNFPKKMGVVTGKTASVSDITKLEEEATKSAKNKGKPEEEKPIEEANSSDDEIIDEVVEEEIVEEEVGENQANLEDEIVEEEVVEEEVLEEEVEEGDTGAVLNSEEVKTNATSSENAEKEGVKTQDESVAVGQTKIPEFTQTEKISNISGSQTGVSEAFVEAEDNALKRIEEDEKRKSKFVMFPKKSDGTGAVNGEGFNKNNIKDGSRSLRFREAPPEQTEADIKNEIKKPKPLWLKITIAVAILVVSVGAVFGAYLGYLQGGYDRVYDYKMLQVVGKNKSNTISLNTSLDIITYNLSYGIMDPEFSYFKAETTMPNGSVKKGSSSRATNKDRVSININGSAELVGKGANSSTDFILFQDVDVDSTRSYYINQQDILADVLSNFAGVFAENGSSNYVFSPISSPLGKIDTRMATFSNKYMSYKIRHSLTSNSEFMEKYGANDNCIILTQYRTTGGKILTVINVNIGIYESEEVRTTNLEEILRYMDYEANTRGNYVVVGGSFGYLLNGEDGEFLNTSGSPSWSECFPESFSTEALKKIGFRVVKDEVALDQKIGTVRDMSTEYNKGVSFEAVIDGFIVSKGVTVEDVSVIDNGFLYSSHNPVKMSFRLT